MAKRVPFDSPEHFRRSWEQAIAALRRGGDERALLDDLRFFDPRAKLRDVLDSTPEFTAEEAVRMGNREFARRGAEELAKLRREGVKQWHDLAIRLANIEALNL
jgi:hypothetical protein